MKDLLGAAHELALVLRELGRRHDRDERLAGRAVDRLVDRVGEGLHGALQRIPAEPTTTARASGIGDEAGVLGEGGLELALGGLGAGEGGGAELSVEALGEGDRRRRWTTASAPAGRGGVGVGDEGVGDLHVRVCAQLRPQLGPVGSHGLQRSPTSLQCGEEHVPHDRVEAHGVDALAPKHPPLLALVDVVFAAVRELRRQERAQRPRRHAHLLKRPHAQHVLVVAQLSRVDGQPSQDLDVDAEVLRSAGDEISDSLPRQTEIRSAPQTAPSDP
mmetsp:Transcript_17405/g.52075  ORF Transcript_17405/g.52075 Transcript_17405/m.52075 type:complete len:274 (+) Transcript_17405:1421-2242(+)